MSLFPFSVFGLTLLLVSACSDSTQFSSERGPRKRSKSDDAQSIVVKRNRDAGDLSTTPEDQKSYPYAYEQPPRFAYFASPIVVAVQPKTRMEARGSEFYLNFATSSSAIEGSGVSAGKIVFGFEPLIR